MYNWEQLSIVVVPGLLVATLAFFIIRPWVKKIAFRLLIVLSAGALATFGLWYGLEEVVRPTMEAAEVQARQRATDSVANIQAQRSSQSLRSPSPPIDTLKFQTLFNQLRSKGVAIELPSYTMVVHVGQFHGNGILTWYFDEQFNPIGLSYRNEINDFTGIIRYGKVTLRNGNLIMQMDTAFDRDGAGDLTIFDKAFGADTGVSVVIKIDPDALAITEYDKLSLIAYGPDEEMDQLETYKYYKETLASIRSSATFVSGRGKASLVQSRKVSMHTEYNSEVRFEGDSALFTNDWKLLE